MSSVNKVIIVGNLGSDPDQRHLSSGSTVCDMSVATSERWTDKGGQKQEHTEWHRVQAWGKLAELCAKYLGKGSKVYVEGKLKTRSWEDQEGNKRYTTEVVAREVKFLDGRQQRDSQSQGYGGGAGDGGFGGGPDEDLPF